MIRDWISKTTAVAVLALLIAGCAPAAHPLPDAVALKPSGQGATAMVGLWKDPAPLPAGFDEVASSGPLRLLMDRTGSSLVVEDRRSGMRWTSTPADVDKEETGDAWKAIMKSTVKVGTTDTKIKATTRPGAAAATQRTAVAHGAKVHYVVNGQSIEFDVVYTLDGESLNVTIPESGITEGKTNMLVYVEPLSFFGAAPDSVPGYLVIPDGSGALIRFDPNRTPTAQGFEGWVYGIDQTLGQDAMNARPVIAPVFGMARDQSAFVAYVTEGDYGARIEGMPSGVVVKYNRASAQLYYRQEYRARVTDTKDVIQITDQRVKGDRAVRYTFLAGTDANYSGMARAYRDYLLNVRGVPRQPLKEYPLSLHLFMGAQEDGLVSSQLRTVTTFSQARTVAEAFRQAGVGQLELTLMGWEYKGYHGDLPNRFPADSAFGGNSGLRTLTAWAKGAGVPLYLQDNAIHAYTTSAGFTPRSMAAESPVGLVVQRRPQRLSLPDVPSDAKPYWLINPTWAADHYFASSLPEYQKLGAGGLELEQAGQSLYSDFSATRSTTRADAMTAWVKMLSAARKEIGSVSVEQGNAYTLGYVNRISDLPLYSSQYVYADQEIPFMPMVLHGVVPYTGHPGNLRENSRLEFLRQVEYGAVPDWELTFGSPAELRSTVYNSLYSGQYTDWASQAVAEYREIQSKVGATAGLLMTDQRSLAPGVDQVTYEDGTRVIVNYTDQSYTAGGTAVPARDFVAVRGGGAQ